MNSIVKRIEICVNEDREFEILADGKFFDYINTGDEEDEEKDYEDEEEYDESEYDEYDGDSDEDDEE